MKTPEEIKKGLECCGSKITKCLECPYEGECHLPFGNDPESDALTYIQQLERERDAAVEQLKQVDVNSYFECNHCKHEELCDSPVWPCNDCDSQECPCHTCADGSNWEWRGVQNDG